MRLLDGLGHHVAGRHRARTVPLRRRTGSRSCTGPPPRGPPATPPVWCRGRHRSHPVRPRRTTRRCRTPRGRWTPGRAWRCARRCGPGGCSAAPSGPRRDRCACAGCAGWLRPGTPRARSEWEYSSRKWCSTSQRYCTPSRSASSIWSRASLISRCSLSRSRGGGAGVRRRSRTAWCTLSPGSAGGESVGGIRVDGAASGPLSRAPACRADRTGSHRAPVPRTPRTASPPPGRRRRPGRSATVRSPP